MTVFIVILSAESEVLACRVLHYMRGESTQEAKLSLG